MTFSAVQSFSRMVTAASLSERTLAFRSWWLLVTLGDGIRMLGVPEAAISLQVAAPDRLMTTSAAAISNGIS